MFIDVDNRINQNVLTFFLNSVSSFSPIWWCIVGRAETVLLFLVRYAELSPNGFLCSLLFPLIPLPLWSCEDKLHKLIS